MSDQWYFDIGDGQTYGPYSMEKLQAWAEAGNLMPTHRVRRADSEEWTIAAYVPGLELTTAAPTVSAPIDDEDQSTALGKLVSGLGKKLKKGEDSHADVAVLDDAIGLCSELLEIAYRRRASDLHIDPEEGIVLIQIRIDGQLETVRKLPKSFHAPVVGRFKVLSRMDIGERRMPQDGQFVSELGIENKKVSIRAACLPTTHGERLTLRLLAVDTEVLTLNRLGMSDKSLRLFTEITNQKQGMVLLTGPTGSGKSTTLYAAIRHRLANKPGRIITVEDPVEFDIVGVAQAEVDSADKLSFHSALRNILRSDPDVIMIGEIRDEDSADIAMKAALTGHMVFSSLHTNSASGVITRLVDMGIEPFLVAATLKLCVAQRLLRRLCPDCHQGRQLTEIEAESIGRSEIAGATVYEPRACKKCGNRGFRGRVGTFEMLPIDPGLERLIVEGAKEQELDEYARDHQVPSLLDDAVEKLLKGVICLSDLIESTRV
jgi:type II secretory ATPase GspE/PulE/Tfp pilus assembly ATPase PilB-like protein